MAHSAFDSALPFVPRGAVTHAERSLLAAGALYAVRTDVERFRLTGTGRLTCLQGLVTCDVEQPGDFAALFGALLTTKGMIASLVWLVRLSDAVLLEVPLSGTLAVEATFTRSLPPRLCRSERTTADTASVSVLGADATLVVGRVLSEEPVPQAELPGTAGRAAVARFRDAGITIARVSTRGLDGFDVIVPASHLAEWVAALERAGAARAGAALLEERRILGGFPRLGAEVDEKTIPQEVRLEALGGVSFTKGCYLGQETVARVHFRGHVNRRLVGLILGDLPPLPPQPLLAGRRPAGRISSVAWSEEAGRYVALGLVRRAVAPAEVLATADGLSATVVDLPFAAA